MLSLSSCKYTLYNCFRIGSVSYLPPHPQVSATNSNFYGHPSDCLSNSVVFCLLVYTA